MKIIGHRTNNKLILRKYLESNIDGIEVDLDIENGELRIKHGPNPIKRPSILGKLMGWIDYKFFYRDPYIKKLSITLNEIIQITNKYKLTLLIDLKNLATAKKIIHEKKLPTNLVFSSKDHYAIKYIKQELGDNVKGLITIDSKPINIHCLIDSSRADGISWNYVFIDEKVLEELKNSGYIIYTWVINDRTTYKKINRTGLIDAIITDAPWKLLPNNSRK